MVNKLVLSVKTFLCFFLVIYVRDRVYISSLRVTEEFFVKNFASISLLTVSQPVQPQDAVVVTLI